MLQFSTFKSPHWCISQMSCVFLYYQSNRLPGACRRWHVLFYYWFTQLPGACCRCHELLFSLRRGILTGSATFIPIRKLTPLRLSRNSTAAWLWFTQDPINQLRRATQLIRGLPLISLDQAASAGLYEKQLVLSDRLRGAILYPCSSFTA